MELLPGTEWCFAGDLSPPRGRKGFQAGSSPWTTRLERGSKQAGPLIPLQGTACCFQGRETVCLRFLYFRDESGVLAVLRVPTKEAGDHIPFKELIKRAPGFVREGGREGKSTWDIWAYSSWKLSADWWRPTVRFAALNKVSFQNIPDTLPGSWIGKDSDVNTVTRTSLVRSPISSRDPRKMFCRVEQESCLKLTEQ